MPGLSSSLAVGSFIAARITRPVVTDRSLRLGLEGLRKRSVPIARRASVDIPEIIEQPPKISLKLAHSFADYNEMKLQLTTRRRDADRRLVGNAADRSDRTRNGKRIQSGRLLWSKLENVT